MVLLVTHNVVSAMLKALSAAHEKGMSLTSGSPHWISAAIVHWPLATSAH
jgi:hypothetical protein